jgi:1D-myo-inositol-tetrakisphosphate 5-kinase/inositol-polyphosphate multikinase
MTKITIVLVLGLPSLMTTFLLWRARNQTQSAAEEVENAVAQDPLLQWSTTQDVKDAIHEQTRAKAVGRASFNLTDQAMDTNQLIGQVGGLSDHKKCFLRFGSHFVLKPLRTDRRGMKEIAFYEAVTKAIETKNQDDIINITSTKLGFLDRFGIWFSVRVIQDPYVVDSERRIQRLMCLLMNHAKLFQTVHPFLPAYFGVTSHKMTLQSSFEGNATTLLKKEGFDDCYLILENVTKKFTEPCIIDVKMGTQSYEPEAKEDKRQREIKKYPSQAKFGLRIVGMRIYNPLHEESCENGFVFFPKHFGRSLLTSWKLKDAFKTFFSSRSTGVDKEVICNVLSQLRAIEQWFVKNDSICFCASSLLIAFEGGDDSVERENKPIVKMIDFARVRKQTGGDLGYLLGLKTLIELFTEILDEEASIIKEI